MERRAGRDEGGRGSITRLIEGHFLPTVGGILKMSGSDRQDVRQNLKVISSPLYSYCTAARLRRVLHESLAHSVLCLKPSDRG